jgi:hypothetical protein
MVTIATPSPGVTLREMPETVTCDRESYLELLARLEALVEVAAFLDGNCCDNALCYFLFETGKLVNDLAGPIGESDEACDLDPIRVAAERRSLRMTADLLAAMAQTAPSFCLDGVLDDHCFDARRIHQEMWKKAHDFSTRARDDKDEVTA